MSAEDPHTRNGLLAALTAEDLKQLRPLLEVVELEHEKVLYESGSRVEQVYFPHNAVVSLVAMMQDGRLAETGTLGREGFTGSETMLGNDIPPQAAVSFRFQEEHPNWGSRPCALLWTKDPALATC
jgi:hypothetical protein